MNKTLVIDNFKGALTSYLFGDINSGRAWVQASAGANPFVKPGQLTWSETPTQIDPNGSVITDLIMCGKERIESGVLYVYAVGHTGRVYKIQVNDPTTYNPNYDNPVLLATLSSNSPTFKYGGFIDFYGSTEKMYIGHDKGVTKINFDGSSEAFVGVLGSWTQNVPRPIEQFLGKMYIGNGSNLAEIDSTETVTSYAKISPGFPTNTQVRDIDVSNEGTYLEAVVSQLAQYDLTSSTQETTSVASSESYIFRWNGTDTGYTSSTLFPSYSLTSNIMFQGYQYTFGTDTFGTALFNPLQKIISIAEGPAPIPNSISSSGNLLTWLMPLYYNGVQEADFLCWGPQDFEVGNPLGYWDLFFINAKNPETDIVRTPFTMYVSNQGLGSSSNNYTGNIYGNAKIYFSTLETSSAPTTQYRFYKWRPNSSTDISPGTPVMNALYQTQCQMFSRRVAVSEVRVYGEPWATGNSFSIDLIGSDGLPITNGSNTFTVGTNIDAGDDFAVYSPQMAPTYTLGLAITNLGTTNHTINKIEIDYNPAGD